jgi:transketolase
MAASRAASRDDLEAMSSTIRRWVVEQAFDSRVGHIGSALSIVEILAVLWGRVMRDPGTDDPERDRFVLAKGHAALALYAALRWMGLLDEDVYRSYCGDGSPLGVHPERGIPGVEVTTGSLGQGLSVACGLAYALRQRGSLARVFALVSDAECNEGQLWEAVMFAAHHRLDNLIVVVDQNGMQAMGPTSDVLDMGSLARRWAAFAWLAIEADGHDVNALLDAATNRIADRTGPAVILAATVLGKGVPFMEGRLEWHYRYLTPELAEQAFAVLEAHP